MHATRSLLALVVFSQALLVGCADYAKVGPDAYQFSKALYSVCNRRDQSRLSGFSAQIESARAESKLTDQEAEWLDDIVTTAQSGEWQAAMQDARRLMEAQVVGR